MTLTEVKMSVKLYNTLTRKKETFVPLHQPKVGMYTCGPNNISN